MRILERVCRECGRMIPEIIVDLRVNHDDFMIPSVVRNCNPENPKIGHLQPCDIEEISLKLNSNQIKKPTIISDL